MSSARLTPLCSTGAETIVVSAPDSTRIVADLLVGVRTDTVLVIPGFWRVRRDPVMLMIASRIHETGLTICTADNRGHGDSAGTFGFNTMESGDIISVLEALKGRGFAGTAGTCVLGFSAGGAIAISCAALRPDLVRGLVLVSPVADFKRVFPRPNPFRMSRHLSLRSVLKPPRFRWHETRRRRALDDARLVTARTCLIHAKDDWLVHHSHSEKLAERLPARPDMHLLELGRVHAERMFAAYVEPWDVLTTFMTESLEMDLSGA